MKKFKARNQFEKMKHRSRVRFLLSMAGILVLLVVVVFIENRYTEAISVEKVILVKDAPIENRFSSTDFAVGEGSVTKSVTVYYFYAEDGTCVEVEPGVYHTKNVGETYRGPWKKKSKRLF